MQKITDNQLIADYLKGDENSLEILIKRYLKPVYCFVCRYAGNAGDAEDVAQEVFVKVWRNLKKFDQKKNFKTWIFTIAKNTSIDFLKKRKALPFSEFDTEDGGNAIADTLADTALLPDAAAERAGTAQSLVLAAEKLSEKYREVVLMRYGSGFTFREIAELLGEPLHTIKSRYRRALAALKEIIAESV